MFGEYVKKDFDKYLSSLENSKLSDIIKYSLEGGKCIRPFIVKHLINILSKNTVDIWQAPVLIELIHCSSLILDDLPCMDNDLVRRNKPSTFVKFGEREAIMCSFYLVSDSFK